MFRQSFRAATLLSLALVAGCASGSRNVKSVKAPDYSKVPSHVVFQVPLDSGLAESFRMRLASSMAKCGTTIQFARSISPAIAKEGHFDAIMTGTPAGEETTTLSNRTGQSTYISAKRFEFSLIDVETQKNVWKEQIDFTNPDLYNNISESKLEELWADAFFDTLTKDGLVGTCDPGKAVPAPTQLTYTAPFRSQTPSSQPTPPPPPRMAAYTVLGKKYPTVEAALQAIHQIADDKVAKAVPISRQTYPSLLVVTPVPAEFSRNGISSLGNKEDFTRFLIGASEIQYDAYIKAFRKTALFEKVETARSDEVAYGDFRGHAYKLWFTTPGEDDKGSWVLASAKGEERRFSLPISDHAVDIGAMLMRADFALDNLPR